MKKRQVLLGIGITAATLSAAAGQVPFTAGNLVVFQAGADGGAALAAVAAPSFLKEIRPSDGAVIQTITLPAVAAVTGNRAVNTRGTSTSEGFLSRSGDSQYLFFIGINANVGDLPNAAGVNRVVGRVNGGAVVDTSMELTDSSYSGDSPRGAYSSNGTDIWLTGTSSTAANGGVRYTTWGSTSATQVNNNTTASGNNTRVAKIFGGQLYVSTMAGAFRGVNAVGTGTPTTSGNILTLLPGFDPGTASTQDVYDFFFLDANTLYVADNRVPASNGGIQKWTQSAGIWSMAYVLNSGLTTGVRGMCASVKGGVPTFYATTATTLATSGNSLVKVTDNGAASAFTTIVSCGANTWFKGVDFAPTGGGPAPCYANCDGSTGAPKLTANDFQCFINKFAANDTYANCDGSTGIPALTANDFQCFINKYAGGCS